MLYCTQEKHHYFFCRGMFWNSVFIACICFVISLLCSHIMSCFFLILHFSPLKFSFQLHDYTRSRANSESVNVETPLPFLTVITIGGSFPTCCCFYRIITYKPSICTWSQRIPWQRFLLNDDTFNKCSKNSPTSSGGEMNCTAEHICSKKSL